MRYPEAIGPAGRAAYAPPQLLANAGQDLLILRQRQRQRRANLLAEAVQKQKISVQDLSPQDAALAGPRLGKAGTDGHSGLFGKVGGFFENLGGDIFSAAKGLPVGITTMLGSIGQDLPGAPTLPGMRKGATGGGPLANTRRNFINPLIQSYKQQYSGDVLGNLYKHPLGPILDALTVVSLGAGGSIKAGQLATRAGSESALAARLAKAGSTTGRPSLLADAKLAARKPDLVQPELTRYYSASPLRKGLQVATDKLGERIPLVAQGQRRLTREFGQKMDYSLKESQTLGAVRDAIQPLVPIFAKLSPEELQAFDLMNRGLVTPERLDAYQSRVQEAISGNRPEGENIADIGSDVDPRLAEQRANIPDEVKSLVLDPRKSEPLMEATQAYRQAVESRIAPELGSDELRAKRYETLDELNQGAPEAVSGPGNKRLHDIDFSKLVRASRDEGIDVTDLVASQLERPAGRQAVASDHPFPEPTIMPSEYAEGFKLRDPGRIARMLTGREAGFTRDAGRTFNPSNLTYANLFQEPRLGFRPNAEPILSGLHRPDARSFVDLIAKHERDVVEKAYSSEQLNRVALKDDNGEPVTAFTEAEVTKKYGRNWALAHPTYPIHWYQKETDVAGMIQKMESQGYNVEGPEVTARLGAEAEDMAKDATFAARRMPGVVIPRDFAEFQRKLENASKPYENKFGRGYARAMNTWRSYTLALMPRWALNTAVGSFTLGVVKGVSPRAYMMANKLNKAGIEHIGPTADDVYFHGTMDPMHANAIGEEGLKVPQEPWHSRFWHLYKEGGGEKERGVYMTPNQNVGAFFGHYLHGVNAKDMNLEIDPVSMDDKTKAYFSRENIPPERVRKLTEPGPMSNWPKELGTDVPPEEARAWLAEQFPKETRERPSAFKMPELAGVNLGEVSGMELLEPGAQGKLDQAFGVKVGGFSRPIMHKVQGIEDHFRRAAFVQSLDKQAKQAMNEQGVILSNVEKMKGPRTTEEYIDFIKENPTLVRRAIEDVNRFSYNFATLGPIERRYVRQAVPFWGWYKFISGLAYRLPIDFPGRAGLMAHIGMLGSEQTEQQLGQMPQWLAGAIPLGNTADGSLRYLSTMGLNPFSQFFNPLGPEGTVSGAIQLGQASPLIQAGLAAYGVDTLRGGSVPISPTEGIGQDFFGSLIDLNKADAGKWPETDVGASASARRFLATIIRSFPQARIAERYRAGGRSVYPESLPWAVRPMATKPESRFGGSFSDLLEQTLGFAPRPYDLKGAQHLIGKRVKYAKTRNKRDLQRLRKNLNK